LLALVGLAIGFLLGFLVASRFFLNSATPPRAFVLRECLTVSPGRTRMGTDFGLQFDASDEDFAIRSGTPDMPPPGRTYVARLKGSDASLVISWADEADEGAGVFGNLVFAYPVFSRRVAQRDILNEKGGVVGIDKWGELNSRERWRYVRFLNGDAAGYEPINTREAARLDEVISSACYLPRLPR